MNIISEETNINDDDDDDEKGAGKAVSEEDNLDWLKPRTLLKPDDQLDIPEGELEEEIGRVLSTRNPGYIPDEVAFNYGRGEFIRKPAPTSGKVYMLWSFQGTTIRKDSEEAKAQIAAGYGSATFDDAGPKKVKVKKSADEEEEEEEEEPAPAGVKETVEEAAPEEVEDETKHLAPEEEQLPQEQVDQKVDGEGEAEGEEKLGEGEGGGEEVETAPEDDFGAEEEIRIAPRVKKLANQFNFCERAALTYNNPVRTVETQTIPPPRANFSDTALQSIIYDFYQQDYEAKMKALEDEKPKRGGRKKSTKASKSAQAEHDELVAKRVREAWSVLERLVNQNIYDDIAQDFRYWDDPSDEFRDGQGSLLPLWKFSHDKARGRAVADIFWNPHYQDMFAVAYGTLDFSSPPREGFLCLYSIKNPAHPEYSARADSPVMALDIHPKHSYLVCVGRYDGNVCVYNTQLVLDLDYQFKSDAVSDKHTSIVWEGKDFIQQYKLGGGAVALIRCSLYITECLKEVIMVKWCPDNVEGAAAGSNEPSFVSVSGDGRVVLWRVTAAELLATKLICLRAEVPPLPGPDGGLTLINSCGSCICFHPRRPDEFLVGTEEGDIHVCSRAYSRTCLATLRAHRMPVHRIHYNHYNDDIFASCGGDWRVHIWEAGRSEPLFTFDLASSVGDVKWAPYSSTVFACCTSDGMVFVFDLNVNKYKPICCQRVVSKKAKKLTRLDFNRHLPVIVCGDTKGTCHVLKLSPNLRVMCRAPKKQLHLDQRALQDAKLDKLLSLVRDPPHIVHDFQEAVEED